MTITFIAIDESIDDDYSPEQKKQKVSTNNIFDNIDDGCYYGIYNSLLASDNISPQEGLLKYYGIKLK